MDINLLTCKECFSEIEENSTDKFLKDFLRLLMMQLPPVAQWEATEVSLPIALKQKCYKIETTN